MNITGTGEMPNTVLICLSSVSGEEKDLFHPGVHRGEKPLKKRDQLKGG